MVIRNVNTADAAAIRNIYQPYVEETSFTFETTVPSVDEMTARIKTYTEKYPWLVATENQEIIGYAYASKHRERAAYQWCVESSVYVRETYHHKGVAKELYEALFHLLQQWGYVNVYAGITLPNPKSEAFHLKMGFEPIGIYKNIGYKLGKWHDVKWVVKNINQHAADPAAPLKV